MENKQLVEMMGGQRLEVADRGRDGIAVGVRVIRGTLCKSSKGGLGAAIAFCLMGLKRSHSKNEGLPAPKSRAGKLGKLVWMSLGYLEGCFLPTGWDS